MVFVPEIPALAMMSHQTDGFEENRQKASHRKMGAGGHSQHRLNSKGNENWRRSNGDGAQDARGWTTQKNFDSPLSKSAD